MSQPTFAVLTVLLVLASLGTAVAFFVQEAINRVRRARRADRLVADWHFVSTSSRPCGQVVAIEAERQRRRPVA